MRFVMFGVGLRGRGGELRGLGGLMCGIFSGEEVELGVYKREERVDLYA